jgi:hypothetical protein
MNILVGAIIYLGVCVLSTYTAWRMRMKRGIPDSFLKYFLLWGVLSPFNVLWEYLIGREPDPRIQERSNAQTHKDARTRMRAFRAGVESGSGPGVGLCGGCANFEARYSTCKAFKVGVGVHVIQCKRHVGATRG